MPSPGHVGRPLAVLDVDGVLADVRHRLPHLDRRPRDWAAFFAAADRDPPLPEGLRLAHELAADHVVVYLTGRPERIRALTEQWLELHGLPPGALYMRPDHDRRPARVMKRELLRRLASGARVATVVDDDPEVIEALLAAGWPARQSDWGEGSRALKAAQERQGRT